MALDQQHTRDEAEMGFFDHIDVLRGHLFRVAIAVASITVICLFYSKFIFDKVLFGPTKSDFLTYKLLCSFTNYIRPILCQYTTFLCPEEGLCIHDMNLKVMNTELFGQFITQIQISVVLGIICAFPYMLWEIWRFVKPALAPEEAKKSGRVIVLSSFFFFIGIAFSYFLIIPFSLNFAAHYLVSEQINNYFSLDNYIGFITMMMLGTGIVFELPMVIFFLAKMGIVTASFMKMYRRHAVVVILILAAVITPSPDMFTMLLVAIPIYILFEISVVVAGKVNP